MADAVLIAGAGLVTPAGLTLRETAASARARMANLGEIEWRDRRFEPFVVGALPDKGLPPLDPSLEPAMLQYREARMLRIAHVAIEELMPLLKDVVGVPLLLALPEHHTTRPIQPPEFLLRLGRQCGLEFDRTRSVAVAKGRAAGLMALRQAGRWLSQGTADFVLVGGVECLVDLYVLGTLDLEERIRGSNVSDGFTPAEGAAFLLLASSRVLQAKGVSPLAAITGVALGQETGHRYAEAPYLGEGLAATFAALFRDTPPSARIGCVFSSFNGERYWAKEYSVARLRLAAMFADDHQMEHPAEVFGDLGAAHGVALAALAANGLSAGYVRSPALVYSSSDRGERAAVLLDKAH